MGYIKSTSGRLENFSLTNYDENIVQGAIYFRANLSDVIEGIEITNLYDIPQLIIEVILTVLCIGGNFLTILVLRDAARKHPAQALRQTLAAFDLVASLLGCVGHIGFHSYYLWCAVNVDRCQYEVEIIQYSNNKQMLLLLGIFPLLHNVIFWIAFTCSWHMPWIMSVERCYAICKPLKHRIYFTISNIRRFVILLAMLMMIQTVGRKWKMMADTNLILKCFYKPEIKFFFYENHKGGMSFFQGMFDIFSISIIVTLSIIFTSIVRMKLKRVKKLQEGKITLNESSNSINIINHTKIISVKEESTHPCASISANPNQNKAYDIKQDNHVSLKIASEKESTNNDMKGENIVPDTPKIRSTNFLQQESVLDMTITHTWLVVIEVTAFLLNGFVVMYSYTSERLENAAPLGIVLYGTFWFGMSSSFFNFLLYNIRIPAFREASWKLITSVTKFAKLWK